VRENHLAAFIFRFSKHFDRRDLVYQTRLNFWFWHEKGDQSTEYCTVLQCQQLIITFIAINKVVINISVFSEPGRHHDGVDQEKKILIICLVGQIFEIRHFGALYRVYFRDWYEILYTVQYSRSLVIFRRISFE
jgi:hypothetical protein